MTTLAQTRNPWEPFESKGKGKGKGGGPVPESGAFGVVLVGLCVALVIAARWANRRTAA